MRHVFLDFDAARYIRKGNFLNHIDHLIYWESIEMIMVRKYATGCEVRGRPAYPELFLFQNTPQLLLKYGIIFGADQSANPYTQCHRHYRLPCLNLSQPESQAKPESLRSRMQYTGVAY